MIHDGNSQFSREIEPTCYRRWCIWNAHPEKWQRHLVMKRSLWFDASMLVLILIAATVANAIR
jgi:hypothetical protein